ncbi:MAG: MCP four helix bundle domain-containing protein [Deltaproteobacteria bacterium]|nr:MCP four helix bundle domain-containing protein [Deltaproteobacteria bacterium]
MLARVKIGTKLVGGYVAICALVALNGLYTSRFIKQIRDADQVLYARVTEPMGALERMSTGFQRSRASMRDALRVTDDAEMTERFLEAIEERQREVEAGAAEYDKGIFTPDGRKMFEQFELAWREYKGIYRTIGELLRRGDFEGANEELGLGVHRENMVREAIKQLVDRKVGVGKSVADRNTADANHAILFSFVGIAVITLLALALGVFLALSITRPLKRMTQVACGLAHGDVEQSVAHRSGDEIGQLADSFRQTIDYIQGVAKGAKALAAGDLSADLKERSSSDVLTRSFLAATSSVRAMSDETRQLIAAAKAGQLATRGDAARFQGAYAEIVGGVNELLDAVVGPLNVAAQYVDRISKGDVPEKISERYEGDFNAIKSNLNACIDAVNLLIADANMLSAAAVEGKLATRADAHRHQGDFRKIVEGVNGTLDAVIGPLNVAAECVSKISQGAIPPRITERYEGDFNVIKDNLNTCIEAVNLLVADAGMLSASAVAGKLATRADAGRHQGDFRKIVEGVNATLDAVMGPINAATEVLQALARQDLCARVRGEFQGDHTKIKDAMNATAEALHDAMAQVAQAVEQVASVSGQIASTSQSVSQGASEQAAALEETSSNLEEMSGITRQNADNTAQANVLAAGAKSAADKGSQAMERMKGAMGKIRQGAEGTAEIIRDINEIAFQTNLLALNAAVEAARAGDAGRGFAVVAGEVRTLAGRAKEAAKKTEDLIRESVALANEGQDLSEEVADDLGEIVRTVAKVTGIVVEIAAASQEQAKGIEQINRAVMQMDKVTQQAAGNAEESSSAAEELSGQAQTLASLVACFQLKPQGRAGASTRALGRPQLGACRASRAERPEDLVGLEQEVAASFKEF